MMLRLADRFELIAPDLQEFEDSNKPDGDFGPKDQASDMAELIKISTLDRLASSRMMVTPMISR